MENEREHQQPQSDGESSSSETSATGPAALEEKVSTSGNGFPEDVFKQDEEVDLNTLFPREDQDLNELFPEKEMRTLLKKVHKSRQDLNKINTRFVDDTEHVVPKTQDNLPEESSGPE